MLHVTQPMKKKQLPRKPVAPPRGPPSQTCEARFGLLRKQPRSLSERLAHKKKDVPASESALKGAPMSSPFPQQTDRSDSQSVPSTILCAYLIPASVLCQIASKRSPEKASHVFRRLACKAHSMSKRVHADFVGVRLLCSAILLSIHVLKTGHRPYQTSTLKERLQPPASKPPKQFSSI